MSDPVGESGQTRREHLEAAWRATGIRPAALDGPLCPASLAHLWAWWHELARTRRSHGWGPEPLSYPDILAWALLTQSSPRPAEVAALLALDQAYLAHLAARQPERVAPG